MPSFSRCTMVNLNSSTGRSSWSPHRSPVALSSDSCSAHCCAQHRHRSALFTTFTQMPCKLVLYSIVIGSVLSTSPVTATQSVHVQFASQALPVERPTLNGFVILLQPNQKGRQIPPKQPNSMIPKTYKNANYAKKTILSFQKLNGNKWAASSLGNARRWNSESQRQCASPIRGNQP